MIRLSTFFLTSILVVAACGGGGQPAATADVIVDMREYSVKSSKDTIPTGTVTLLVRNVGSSAHDFMIIKSDLPSDKLPQEGAKAKEDDKVFGIGELNPGGRKTVSVDLKPGKYIFICNVAGHYGLGMHTSVTVP